MSISRQDIERLVYTRQDGTRRFTQDSPVYPEVWLAYCLRNPDRRVDLILTPHRSYTPSELLVALRENLLSYRASHDLEMQPWQKANSATTGQMSVTLPWRLANAGDSVAVNLTFHELVRVLLPMTGWWANYLWGDKLASNTDEDWIRYVVGAIAWSQQHTKDEESSDPPKSIEELKPEFDKVFVDMAGGMEKAPPKPYYLWSVSLNRRASVCLDSSVLTTKADASRRLFEIDSSKITWAILDTGIDARHDAFRTVDRSGEPYDSYMEKRIGPARKNHTRVVATYDFTKLRDLMANVEGQVLGEGRDQLRRELIGAMIGAGTNDRSLTQKEMSDLIRDLERSLKNGRMLDWSVIGPLLRIPHNRDEYKDPKHPHGTHVAGILGANMSMWQADGDDSPLMGMCPEINLYDLRVLDDDGAGDEYSIIAALQFVRWLNKKSDQYIIHGANLSLSLPHNVVNFACGRTPICEECQRLVAEGTVVVAAAGNQGRAVFRTQDGFEEGYRSLSITDPGNAEAVITVGSTHRKKPHTYGVSYFSSRGPTGDGRFKPDLLAPGEKIKSTVLDGDIERMDGTSMAAPHVSGAAALLLARHRELIGQPGRIKEILCSTATDLGRERYFQGHGLVDTLRALQSL